MKLGDFEHLIPGLVLGNWSSLHQAVKHGHNRVIHYLNTYYSLLNEAEKTTLISYANTAAINGRVDLVQMFAETGVFPSTDVLPIVVARGHAQMWEYLINVCGFPQLRPEQMYVCYAHFKHLVTPDLVARFNHVDVVKHLVEHDCLDLLKELYPSLPFLSIQNLLHVAIVHDSIECFKYLLDYIESKGFVAHNSNLQQMVFRNGSNRIMRYYAERYDAIIVGESFDGSLDKYANILVRGSPKLFDVLIRKGYIRRSGPGLSNILHVGSVDALEYWYINKDGIDMARTLNIAFASGMGGGLPMIKRLVQYAEDDDADQNLLMDVFQNQACSIYGHCVKHKQFASFMYFLKLLQIRLPMDLPDTLQRMARYDKVKVGVKFLDVLKDYLLF